MKIFPIAVRTYDRPWYLDITLHSLLGTRLPENCEIIIFDDCSTTFAAKQYLFTNESVKFNNWTSELDKKLWEEVVGPIPNISTACGIKDKFEVIQPPSRKGVLGFGFWIIDYMMQRFPEAEAVHMLEADMVLNHEWYEVMSEGYERLKNVESVNGKDLGLLSGYDVCQGKKIPDVYDYSFRCTKHNHPNPKVKFSCGNVIGGVHFMVTRVFYERGIKHFKDTYNVEQKAGDSHMQKFCVWNDCNVAVSVPCTMQHIGIHSVAWKRGHWPYTLTFKKPYAWKETIER